MTVQFWPSPMAWWATNHQELHPSWEQLPPILVTVATHWVETTCVSVKKSMMGHGQAVIHLATVSSI